MANAVLKDYDGDYLLCRNVGHHWDVVGYFRAADGLVCRDLVCSRCGTDRLDRWVRSSGERVGSTYRYAHGYKVETGEDEDRPTGTDVRSGSNPTGQDLRQRGPNVRVHNQRSVVVAKVRRADDPATWLDNPDGSKSAMLGAAMLRGEWLTSHDAVAMGCNQSMANQVRSRLKKAGYRLEAKSAGPAGLKAYRVRPGKGRRTRQERDRRAGPGYRPRRRAPTSSGRGGGGVPVAWCHPHSPGLGLDGHGPSNPPIRREWWGMDGRSNRTRRTSGRGDVDGTPRRARQNVLMDANGNGWADGTAVMVLAARTRRRLGSRTLARQGRRRTGPDLSPEAMDALRNEMTRWVLSRMIRAMDAGRVPQRVVVRVHVALDGEPAA